MKLTKRLESEKYLGSIDRKTYEDGYNEAIDECVDEINRTKKLILGMLDGKIRCRAGCSSYLCGDLLEQIAQIIDDAI